MTAHLIDEDIQRMLRVKEGDAQSFNELMARYTEPLINFAYRYTGSRNDAEEIAQDTFLRVYRAAAGYQPSARFSTWLFRIAANLCRDYRRKRASDPLSHAEPVQPEESESGRPPRQYEDTDDRPPEKHLERAETGRRVRAAMGSLPPNQRLALTLRLFDDKSYAEIAEILSVSIATVESLLFRARQNLKKSLSPGA